MKPGFLRKVVFLLSLSVFAAGLSRAETKPNIVIILADDLGYGDLGCYGNPSIRTPNLDRMAAEGLRFTEFYSGACLCTPSRAALLTGRLALRSGMAGSHERHVIYPENTGGLPQTEISIPRALKTKGYATAAIGKWHLGHHPESVATSHGFDSFYGLPYSNDSDPIDKKLRAKEIDSQTPDWHSFTVPLIRGTNIIERPADQTKLTKNYTEEAIRFIKENKKKPFFLYFAHTFPHVPLFTSPAFKGKSLRGLYGDAVEEVDWSVGEVLKTLKDEKLDKNTLVLFTSDNGPWIVRKLNGGSAGLFRDGKGGTWEGGYRVPAIARWPGKIKPGLTHEMASALDLYKTCLNLAGAEIPKDRPLDGFDMAPILFGNGKSQRDEQFYYFCADVYAVRKGNYKAHFVTHDGYSKLPEEKHEPGLLFDVRNDPSERFNIAADHPEIVADLKKAFEKHRAEVTPGKAQY
jgi:arylsulfatase A